MHNSHTEPGNAMATLCHPLRQQRQKQYLKRLNRLTSQEGAQYLTFYDAIASNQPVPVPLTGAFSQAVLEMIIELTDLVQEITTTQNRQDQQGFCQLHSYLDDLNIAVNAWKNQICIGRSGFLYGMYRQMQQTARYPSCN
jgi:hypothetical protein